MKKLLYLAMTALMLFSLSSCAGKMKSLDSRYIKVTPQPMELIGGKVPVMISATFPSKWFNKHATLVVTPVLRYKTGETWGTSYSFQGEKVFGNHRAIPYRAGANVEMKSSFTYTDAMQTSELFLYLTVKMKGKKYDLPSIKVADGVVATEGLASVLGNHPAVASDGFQRIIRQAYDANIMFLIQQAQLRQQELKKGEVMDWKNLVKNADETPNQKVSVEIQAYASPDGGLDLNEKLAREREQNTRNYLNKDFKRSKVNVPIDAIYTAQDWEGFKALVEKSNLQDKELVLRVLSMYKDPEEREREIKNISSVFSQLAEDILPQLRRSRLIANVEIIGKSDEEISHLVETNPGLLKNDEILYAATLTTDPVKQKAIYEKTIALFPNDYRAYNNLGSLAFREGNLTQAEKWFNDANQKLESKEANMNLALLQLGNGRMEEAQALLGQASGIPEFGSAMGLMYLKSGQYAKAVEEYADDKSNNAALAQLLSKDYDKAMQTLQAVEHPNAVTDYLRAVVSARMEKMDQALTSLRAAFAKDPSLVHRAAQDLEFAKYRKNPAFSAIVK